MAVIHYSEGGMWGDINICIDNFEVFKKRKGIGSEIIKDLTKDLNGSEIYLYPWPGSHTFWKKHKFKGIDDGSGTTVLRYPPFS